MTRTKTVKSSVRWVKLLHVLMMIGWPAVLMALVVGDSYLFRVIGQDYTPFHRPLTMLVLFVWLLYVYFMMVVMRNYNLQLIAMQECDFDAYLECMQYLGKFQFVKRKKEHSINLTDAYLMKGDFDAAYENLIQLKEQYYYFSDRMKMMYDYFWCRFYAELEDVQNFHICLNAFRNNWIFNQQTGRRMQKQAAGLLEELNLRDMLFAGKNERIKENMMRLYAAGRITTRYEFVRYCYFMGRLEYNMNHLEIAKHWFAQTVSFGLQECMSKKAADFLWRLDEMRVPYAAIPPSQNQYYCNSRRFSMAFSMISIMLGLFMIFAMMILL